MGLSSGFPTRSCSNRPAQLQRLHKMLKLCMNQVNISYLQEPNTICADQTVRGRGLICVFAVIMQQSQGFSLRSPMRLRDPMRWLILCCKRMSKATRLCSKIIKNILATTSIMIIMIIIIIIIIIIMIIIAV